MVKILHCADIHLDSPFAADTPERAELRRHELRRTFSAMMDYVKTNAIDLVLIAGDLFDREFVTRDTVACVLHAFAADPGCTFVITPGNHDPYTADSVYARVTFPENVVLFRSETLTRVSLDRLGVDVYGYAFCSPELPFNPFADRRPEKEERINIVCAHGSLRASGDRCCPIAPEEIERSGFDYYALGHYHNSDGIHRIGNRCYAYSGCPEGRDFGETGYKGAILVEIEKKERVPIIAARPLRFSQRRYEILKVNLGGITETAAAYARIREAADAASFGSDTAVRIETEGSVSPEVTLSPRRISSMLEGRYFSLEVKDRTMPLFDQAKLETDLTLRGAFYRSLLPQLHADSAEEREIAALALRYGLSAMEGGDLNFE